MTDAKPRYKCFDKFPVLISYAYARGGGNVSGEKVFAEMARHPAIDVMLDCGAHSVYNSDVEITIDEYCDFVRRYEKDMFSYVTLDVIANPQQTRINLDYMYKVGLDPMPIHVLGDDGKRMDELFERADYVALGGCIRARDARASLSEIVYPYIVQKMEWAKGRRVHWFGFTRKDLIPTMAPFSSDSCTWCNGQLYGQCCVYMGNGQWVSAYGYKDRAKLKGNREALRLCERVCPGFSASIDDPESWKHSLKHIGYPHRITTDSWVRWVIDVRRMFGTRVFLAANPNRQVVGPLIDAIERHAHLFLRSDSND